MLKTLSSSYFFFMSVGFPLLLTLSCGCLAETEPSVVADQYLLKFERGFAIPPSGSVYQSHFLVIDKIGDIIVIEDMNGTDFAVRSGQIVNLRATSNICALLRANDSYLTACALNAVRRVSSLPNDPYVSMLWGLRNTLSGLDINATTGWDLATDASSVVVAVLDTGVDYSHPDLTPNMWRNPSEIPGNGVDDDHNGYVDDVHGISTVTSDGNPIDTNIHGTHVAGIIGAVGNNGIGISGVCWRAQIMAIAAAKGGLFSSDSILRGVAYIIDQKQRGVNVVAVNASFGGGYFSEVEFEAYRDLRDAGIVLVAAAGNESSDNDITPTFPASYDLDNIVRVAALNSSGRLASFSNYGATSVQIAAPGEDIVSTKPGSSYEVLPGTSMAAPYVTGAMTLLAAYSPGKTPSTYIKLMLDSATIYPPLVGLVTEGRMLNLGAMLQAVQPLPPNSIEPTVPSAGMSAKLRVHKRTVQNSAFSYELWIDGSTTPRLQGATLALKVANKGCGFCYSLHTASSPKIMVRGRLPLNKGANRFDFSISANGSTLAQTSIRIKASRGKTYSTQQQHSICRSAKASLRQARR